MKPKHVAVIVVFNFNKLLRGRLFISNVVNIVYIRHNGITHISFLFNLKTVVFFSYHGEIQPSAAVTITFRDEFHSSIVNGCGMEHVSQKSPNTDQVGDVARC